MNIFCYAGSYGVDTHQLQLSNLNVWGMYLYFFLNIGLIQCIRRYFVDDTNALW